MKFIHLSDLHIGKRVNEMSMLEDQEHILREILNIIDEESPDAVMIAGDVYDKSIPTTEAVELLDSFLYRLSKRETEVFIISGNHDSSERLAFGSRLIDQSGIHISPVYRGEVTPFSVKGVNIWLLPFIKPAHVRPYFPDEKINSYNDALRVAVEGMHIDTEQRNILVTHQFVTGSSRTESEDISVGGTDNIDAEIFADFDYVALGHIHRPQTFTIKDSERLVRYSGTPIAISFDEEVNQSGFEMEGSDLREHGHSLSIVEIHSRGAKPTVRTERVKNIHPLITLPEDGPRPWNEVKEVFDKYPSSIQSYIRLNVAIEDTLPSSAYAEVHEIAKKKACRFCLINAVRQEKSHTATHRTMELSEFQQQQPIDILKRYYHDKNGGDLPQDLEEMFLTAVKELEEQMRES